MPDGYAAYTGPGRTRVSNKGVTASRPTPSATDVGQMYLDTTLDADGLPIFWQGTKWIKADGTNA